MPDDFDTFARRMEARADALPRAVANVVARVAEAVTGTLAVLTPVDTGLARSNWLLTVGEETDDVIDPHSPYEKLTSARKFFERANAQGTIEAGLEAFAEGRGLVEDGAPVFVQNNVPYIFDLNYNGISAQSSHFVEQAVIMGEAEIRDTPLNLDAEAGL